MPLYVPCRIKFLKLPVVIGMSLLRAMVMSPMLVRRRTFVGLTYAGSVIGEAVGVGVG